MRSAEVNRRCSRLSWRGTSAWTRSGWWRSARGLSSCPRWTSRRTRTPERGSATATRRFSRAGGSGVSSTRSSPWRRSAPPGPPPVSVASARATTMTPGTRRRQNPRAGRATTPAPAPDPTPAIGSRVPTRRTTATTPIGRCWSATATGTASVPPSPSTCTPPPRRAATRRSSGGPRAPRRSSPTDWVRSKRRPGPRNTGHRAGARSRRDRSRSCTRGTRGRAYHRTETRAGRLNSPGRLIPPPRTRLQVR